MAKPASSKRTPLSKEAGEARRTLPLEALVSASQDKIHSSLGKLIGSQAIVSAGRFGEFTDAELEAYLAHSKAANRVARATRVITQDLYPEQHRLLSARCRRKVVLTPRQVGKTHTLARYLLMGALTSPSERAIVAYVTDTRDHAYDLVWRPLLDILDATGIDYTPSIVDLEITIHSLRGDRIISLFGVDDERKAQRLRGYQFWLFVVDEAQSIPDLTLRRLIQEDVSAGLGAWDGTLLLCGTPGRVMQGLYYEISTDCARYGYELFRWTHDDNVLFPRWAGEEGWQALKDAWLEQEKVGRSEAAWRREYLGVWCADESSYCYHLGPQNDPDGRDLSGLPCVLGIDLGWHDATALALLSADRSDSSIHVRMCVQHTGMGIAALAALVQTYISEYRPVRIVMDSAGAGKVIQESMSQELANRFGVGIQPAKKTDKAVHMIFLDNLMRTGKFKVPHGPCRSQLESVVKDQVTGIEHKSSKCDMADAVLYAARECYEYLPDRNKVDKPVNEEDLMLESILGREVHRK